MPVLSIKPAAPPRSAPKISRRMQEGGGGTRLAKRFFAKNTAARPSTDTPVRRAIQKTARKT
ncbi:hypothetical protein HMPREF9120_01130 [Neisseria sp. oral taxon 020 str. F0370]|nr:hypothetical protein HMPREF9120_01130 [Neisseria sp. oral taxon 020 str. F0370]